MKDINTETVYEDYTEALLKLLKDFDNISFIMSNDKAFELVEGMEEIGCKFNDDDISFSDFEELYNTDTLLISKSYWCGEYHYGLECAYGNNHLKTIENQDVVFVEDGIIDSDEIKKYINCDVVSLFEEDDYCEDIEEDGLDDLFEGIVEEVIETIVENQDNEEFCLHCTLKDAIQEAYEMGREDLKDELQEQLEEI